MHRPISVCVIALSATLLVSGWWMVSAGAPISYAFVNLAALIAGLVLAFAIARVPAKAALIAPAALGALALAFGPSIDGVHRWVALGGISIHATMLAGPCFAVAFQRIGGWPASLATVAFAAVTALQPDFGMALALACSVAVTLLVRRDLPTLVALACAALAAVWAAWRGDPLSAVPFVEGVMQRMASDHSPAALISLALLALATTAPALLREGRQAGGLAFAGYSVGLVGASLIGPLPTPLVGYGAAPILGYCLALGLLIRPSSATER
ncbi:hypothetical protein EB810_14200 [Altererythrobacter sp. FM1]|uniref:hypothetical protein n=1 Tax=Tsuneonella flava TaxID=2055955 RepID=UPI000C806A7F|nr:hypothetical protein [Tsuneonella flava]ROT94214.1 hypothetical protein EB810_14200 [Altererythrobacter sp. FM1]